jgi:hypothetical protein
MTNHFHMIGSGWLVGSSLVSVDCVVMYSWDGVLSRMTHDSLVVKQACCDIDQNSHNYDIVASFYDTHSSVGK